ncbi:MAG: hypothetical protein HUU15_08210 [Candidatus Brocadiae bacterium]|nr:hypothetical protein [Candidatus Brocadiia bacterium]
MTDSPAPAPPGSFRGSAFSAAFLAAAFAAVYVLHALVYRGSSHQDAANHYGYARDAWGHLWALLDPWGRPLWTGVCMLPARFGLTATRAACALLSGWALFETWRLARRVAPDSALLAIPAMGLQVHFFALAGDNMTEPLFALVFAIAYRLWLEERRVPSLLVASLLPLARPEGFFLGVLWGLFTLAAPLPLAKRLTLPLLLLGGTILWTIGGVVADGDVMYIAHHWPSNWVPGGVYGYGRVFHYVTHWPEWAGPAFLLPFCLGLAVFAAGRPRIHLVTFGFFFLLHTVLWWRGLFGSIGYLRYFVCIAPLTALFTAEGLRFLAAAAAAVRIPPAATAAIICAGAGVWAQGQYLVQGELFMFRAYEEAIAEWRPAGLLDPPPACVADAHARALLHDHDLFRFQPPSLDRAAQLEAFGALPPGTRILWDDRMGGGYYGLGEEDFREAGYRAAARHRFDLYAARPAWVRRVTPHRVDRVEITLYEKRP